MRDNRVSMTWKKWAWYGVFAFIVLGSDASSSVGAGACTLVLLPVLAYFAPRRFLQWNGEQI